MAFSPNSCLPIQVLDSHLRIWFIPWHPGQPRVWFFLLLGLPRIILTTCNFHSIFNINPKGLLLQLDYHKLCGVKANPTWVLTPFLESFWVPYQLLGCHKEGRAFCVLLVIPSFRCFIIPVKLETCYLNWNLDSVVGQANHVVAVAVGSPPLLPRNCHVCASHQTSTYHGLPEDFLWS